MSCLGWALLRLAERERGCVGSVWVWGRREVRPLSVCPLLCYATLCYSSCDEILVRTRCAIHSSPKPKPAQEEEESKKQAKQGGVLQFFTFFNVENELKRCGQVFLGCRNYNL